MYIRSYDPVLWRSPDEAQVGIDAAHACVLEGMAPEDHAFLTALPSCLTQSAIYRARRSAGISQARAARILQDLEERGAVRRYDTPPVRDADVYWDRLGYDHAARAAALHGAQVALLGAGAVCGMLAGALVDAGVGTLQSEDAGIVSRLSVRYPNQRVTRPDSSVPDLAVLVCDHVIDPVRERSLAQEGIAHLPVVIGEVTSSIGPYLADDSPLCRSCLELWHCEEDPCWPVVATQARYQAPARLDRLIEQQVAVCAARVVIDLLTTGTGLPATVLPGDAPPAGTQPPAAAPAAVTAGGPDVASGSGEERGSASTARAASRWATTSLEVGGTQIASRLRRWRPHPECLCTVLATAPARTQPATSCARPQPEASRRPAGPTL